MSTAYERFSPLDKLATARLAARQQFPYFAAALLSLVPKEAPGLGTFGVSEDLILAFDPEAINRWPLEETVATLVHEIGHVLRDHAKRCKAAGFEPRLWNTAGDAEINDDLVPIWKFVDDPSVRKAGQDSWVLPKQFGADDGLTAEAYYHKLQQLAQKSGGKGVPGQGDPEEGGVPKAGRGWCGGAAGRPLPGEPQPGQPNDKGEVEGRSAAEVDRVRKQVADAIKDVAQKGRGTVPAGWLRWAEAFSEPPKVNWREKLARVTRYSLARVMGKVDYSYHMPSRRQAGLGFGPGRPILPSLIAYMPKVDFWADTSGSMGKDELTTVLREARGVVLRSGAQIRFGACDAAVHELQVVKDWRKLPEMLKGGGGTDFCPIFEAVRKTRKQEKPDVVIVATDGDGSAPARAPDGVKVIWLLVGHKSKPCNWGEIIECD